MNCYDFDNTIYAGDSSQDFYRFCLLRYPRLLRRIPAQVKAFCGHYISKSLTKTQMKEVFYQYFRDIPDFDNALAAFWAKHLKKIKRFYLQQQSPEDVIISASPEFFLNPACEQLGIVRLIASPVVAKTGYCNGENCHGDEKVRRFRLLYPEAAVEEFYSDSLSDAPMAHLAKKAYLVKGERLLPWPKER